MTSNKPRRFNFLGAVWKRWLLGLILLAALAYAAVVAYLMVNEKALIFHPHERTVVLPDTRWNLNQRTVNYVSSEGVRLSAWVVPAKGDSAMWMLICHGNFGNIGYGQRPEFYSLMRNLGLNLLAFDYRGYGDSTGSPDEKGLYADARASYDYLTLTLKVPPERIVIFGHSLGSGVAIELASRVPAAALVVEGAYTSVTDRAQELYPLLPVRWVSSQRFASIDRVPNIALPKLFLHSPQDVIIPIAHGRRLSQAAAAPARLVEVQGGHENAYAVDKDVYFGAIAELLLQVAIK
jgi:pimeloyl-ACP methyl ester carboxylesterase